MSNLKQLYFAFVWYGEDYGGYAMPATAPSSIYWWGKKLSSGIDRKQGFVWPYLESELSLKSVYECPAQPYGSYHLQGVPPGQKDGPKWMTSTYGYNGYFLCPSQSGWYDLLGPWQKISGISSPMRVLVFADTLIDLDMTGRRPVLKNTFLLDPPYIYSLSTGDWIENSNPTTCFRHNEKTNAIFVDGHCASMTPEGAEYASPAAKIGSIGTNNAPYYVPNYLQWPVPDKKRRRR